MAYQGLVKYQISFPLFKVTSCKNSKCLDFVLVKVTCIVRKRHSFSFHATQNQKRTPVQHNGIPRASKISNYFPIIQSHAVSCKNSKCLDFVLVKVTCIVQERRNFSFHVTQNQKMTPIQHNGIARASKISN